MSPSFSVCAHPRCYVKVAMGTRYCRAHAEQYQKAQARAARRFEADPRRPWTLIYADPMWLRCREIVLARDGRRCVHVTHDGERCPIRRKVSVHHLTRIRTLWEQTGGRWETFQTLATDPDKCVTLCASHHKEADDKLRDEDRRNQPYTAPPRPKPSDRRKRRGR